MYFTTLFCMCVAKLCTNIFVLLEVVIQHKRNVYRQYYTCLSRIVFIIRYIDTSNKRNIYEYMFNTLKLVLMYIYEREN